MKGKKSQTKMQGPTPKWTFMRVIECIPRCDGYEGEHPAMVEVAATKKGLVINAPAARLRFDAAMCRALCEVLTRNGFNGEVP